MIRIGPAELLVVLGIAVLLLGPKRLPEIGRAAGSCLTEFLRAVRGLGAGGVSRSKPAAEDGERADEPADEGHRDDGPRG